MTKQYLMDKWDKPLWRLAVGGGVIAMLSMGWGIYHLDREREGPSSPPAVARAYDLQRELHSRYRYATVSIDELLRPDSQVEEHYQALQREYEALTERPEIVEAMIAYRSRHKRYQAIGTIVSYIAVIGMLPVAIASILDMRTRMKEDNAREPSEVPGNDR